jgi:phosphoglycolate phosphatase
MVGDGAPTLLLRAFAAVGLDRPPDALGRFLALYDARLLNNTRPYAGMSDALDQLADRASLAVLTNKPLKATRAILGGLDLAQYFADEAILGGDGPFPRKPDPEGLQQLCERVGVPADNTLLVGDSVIDWQTARNAATSICLARYGFGFEGFPLADLRPDDHLIDAPLELLQLLGP